MNRLPSYDMQTSRVESGAFLGLSLVAVALITITALDSTRFARERDGNPMGLSTQSTATAQTKMKAGSTNLTSFEPATPTDRARLTGFGEPKS
jgi:hypothetical protein